MVPLLSLWLPILLSAVIVFVASSLIHMLTPWHKGDYLLIPDEQKFLDTVRPLNVPPGDYMFPRPSSAADMRSPEYMKKRTDGPVGMLTVFRSGPVTMGRELGLWFLYAVVVSIFAGYIAGRALPPGAHYLKVFRFAGCTAFIGYTLALWQMWIWYRRATGTTIRSTIDGLLYGLLTAGVFGWLWPR